MEVVNEFAAEGDKYITCLNTCQNESFNNLITLYAPKGVFYGSNYDLHVALAVLHNNIGKNTFRQQLYDKIINTKQDDWKEQSTTAVLDEDLTINDEDLPETLRKRNTNIITSSSENKTPRKSPECKSCGKPMKGHGKKCNFKQTTANN